jgi:hypothetical protein
MAMKTTTAASRPSSSGGFSHSASNVSCKRQWPRNKKSPATF